MNIVYTYNPHIHQKVYKKTGTSYLVTQTQAVIDYVKENRIKMHSDYFYLDMKFYMPRKNADSHNYKKLLLDVLEHGGLVENDSFIMDRTQFIGVDKENPRCEMEFEYTKLKKGEKPMMSPRMSRARKWKDKLKF